MLIFFEFSEVYMKDDGKLKKNFSYFVDNQFIGQFIFCFNYRFWVFANDLNAKIKMSLLWAILWKNRGNLCFQSKLFFLSLN